MNAATLMSNGPRYVEASNDLQHYIQCVCNDLLGEVPKHASGWEAAFVLGFHPVDIGSRNYISMRCALNLCPNYVDK